MKLAWQMLQEKYPHLIIFGCLAHGLNLLAKDIISLNSVQKILSKCKAIVKLFKNYHVANQTLKSIQKENQGKERSLFSPQKRNGVQQRDVLIGCCVQRTTYIVQL